MLNPAWYLLTERDWFAERCAAPRLSDHDENLIDQIGELFSDESYLTPAKTAATMHVMLLAAERLGDNLAYIPHGHDVADIARLVVG